MSWHEMQAGSMWTRRALLKAFGIGAGGLAVAGCQLARRGGATTGRLFERRPKRLIFIVLGGGLDGIHAVQPKGDPAYAALRRGLDAEPATLCLDPRRNFAFLHPRLSTLGTLWWSGNLAIVHRVGFGLNHEEKSALYEHGCDTCGNRSYPCHHVARRAVENGDPSSTACDGWLYRYARENRLFDCDHVPMLAVQPGTPLVMHSALAACPTTLIHPAGVENLQCPARVYPVRSEQPNLCDEATNDWNGESNYCCVGGNDCPSLAHADPLADVIRWDAEEWHPRFPRHAEEDPLGGTPLFPYDLQKVRDGVFPDLFYWNLKMCALSLLEDDGTRIVATEIGSVSPFILALDWHREAQYPGGGEYMGEYEAIARGLRALPAALGGSATGSRSRYRDVWQDAVIVVMSEFGRSSSVFDGTSHGDATCAFVAGGAVKGGVYNCDPGSWEVGPDSGSCLRQGLGPQGTRDGLSVRTDYRTLLSEVLVSHMNARPATLRTIFPSFTPGSSLGLFA